MHRLQGALDSAMERAAWWQRARHADVAAFQTARTQYRNALQPIIQAATSGENAALGNLTPGKLEPGRVNSCHGTAAIDRQYGKYRRNGRPGALRKCRDDAATELRHAS